MRRAKKGKKEIAEAGDESSLSDNMSDDLKQKKSPHNFAEIHCSEVMQLGVLLSKVHFYLELLAEKDIPFQINLSDKEMKREVKNSRETFLRIVEFLLEKDVFGVNKVSFRAFNFSENKCSIKSEVQYGENISSQKFEVGLLGRG